MGTGTGGGRGAGMRISVTMAQPMALVQPCSREQSHMQHARGGQCRLQGEDSHRWMRRKKLKTALCVFQGKELKSPENGFSELPGRGVAKNMEEQKI